MPNYILLMHDDTTSDPSRDQWERYFTALRAKGGFDGGSSIGHGTALRKDAAAAPVTGQLAGYIRIRAASLEAAEQLVCGNPVFECGGTVEVRELPRD